MPVAITTSSNASSEASSRGSVRAATCTLGALAAARRSSATDSANSCLPGTAFARLNWPPSSARGFEQGDLVTALGGDRRARQPGGAAAHHGNALSAPCFQKHELRFASGPRIHDAARGLAGEVVVEAGLVAGDADVDRRAVAGLGFGCRTPGRRAARAPSTPGPRRRARGSPRQSRAALMRLEAATGMRTASLQAPRGPCERAARHRLRDGRDARLVPADAGIEDRGRRPLRTPAPGSASAPARGRPRPDRAPRCGTR